MDSGVIEMGNSLSTLKTPQYQDIGHETRARLLFFQRKTDNGLQAIERIPKHGIILDIGCGSGGLGVAIAQERQCRLLQADIIDRREIKYMTGNLVGIPSDEPPKFEENKVIDSVLLIDVLDKVVYPGMEGAKSKLYLLKSLLPILTDNGNIFIVSTRENTTQTLKQLDIKTLVDVEPQLSQKIIFCTGDRELDNTPLPTVI